MIFRNLLGKVMSKLADLSPVRNLLKYILDRTLNEFLSDQIQIEDFKDVGDGKVLMLTNISLNREKINRESLLSSPYILHAGTMGKLNIKLPNLSEIASKSIEISADQLVLDLKPNKKFAQNFKDIMKEQQENVIVEQMEEPGEISENSPLDFFRQLVKQMLLNMLIKFENVVIRLFINEPSESNPSTTTKPQYYLMFRIPLLTLGKSEDVPPSQQSIESVRFDSVLPQLSIHLLREGVRYPQFANENVKESDFPFSYPTLKHPGTLLVMGKTDLSKETAAKLRLTLTTNYQTQKKQLNIEGRIGSIQATIDPIQLKILSRFIAQLQQFQKVLKSVMYELGLITIDNLGVSRQSIDFTMSRTNSGGHKSTSLDLFSSMVMSINEPSKPSNKQVDFYSSIAARPELKGSANEFNFQACRELKKEGQTLPGEGYKNINFKQQLILSFNMEILQLNFLKYVSQITYERGWSIDRGIEHVNTSLSCSHFRGEMRNLNYSFSTVDNKHKVTMKFVTLHDVKVPKSNLVHNHASEEFYDIDSNTFYSQNVNQDYFTSQPELQEFKLMGKEHFCMQELLRVSDGASPSLHTSTIHKYSFMPEHPAGKEEGLSLIFNSHKKVLKIEVKEVAVMVNFQVWKDALNILFPIFLYRQLVQKTTINGERILLQEESESQQMKFNPFESAYIFTGNIVDEIEAGEKPMGLMVQIGLIYFMYRQTSAVLPHQNLITQVQTKIHDYDNFSHGCFCDLTERALYAQVFGFKLEKQRENMNIQIKQIKTGFLSLKKSHTSDSGIEAFLAVQGFRMEESKPSPDVLRTRVYLPKVRFNLELPELVTFIDMIKIMVGTLDSLQNFKKNLSSKIVCIDLQNGTLNKTLKDKVKKQKIIQVFSDQISLKTILITTCIRSLYFRKEGKQQQVKINSVALGVLKNINTSLAQFRNELVLSTYPHIQTFEGIDDTSLILELGRTSEPIVKKKYISDPKSKLARKLDFFDVLSKDKYSLSLFLNQKTQAFQNKYDEKHFRFNKNTKKNSNSPSVIDEEKHSKCIDVLLGCPLHFYLGNVAYLIRQKEELENIVKKVTGVLEQIKRDSKDMMISERKDSTESIESQSAEILVKVNGGDMIVDMRPQFSFDPKKDHRILSNTRLIAKLSLNKFQLVLCPEAKSTKIDSSTNLQIFFLHHHDKDIEINPTFIRYEDLKSLGFRDIATLGELVMKGQHSGLSESGTFEVEIDDIKLNLCVSSIPSLELFWEHFFKHSISGDFGIEENFFEVLEEEIEEVEILNGEDIEELQKKIQQKKQIQRSFERSDFLVRVDPSIFKGIFLKKITVARISMNFFAGNQFKFIDCNSLYESKAKARTCSEDLDQAHFVSLSIDRFMVQASISEETKTLIEFERMAIDYSFNRVEGIMWKNEKSYIMPILRIEKPLRVLMHIGPDYLRVKLSHLELSLGFTDQILTLADCFAQESKIISKSGWKLSYLQQKKEVSNRTVLIIAPAGLHEGLLSKITLTVEIKNNKILTDRALQIQKLFIHEPLSNSARINQIIKKWINDILMKNLGTLVTGAFSEVICRCVQILFGAIRHILGFFVFQVRQ